MYKFLKFVGAALEDGFKGDSSVVKTFYYISRGYSFKPQRVLGWPSAPELRINDPMFSLSQKCTETMMNIGRMWLSPRHVSELAVVQANS